MRTVQPVRIMPLGDSITLGSYGQDMYGGGGYRAVLWRSLELTTSSVDLVGSMWEPVAGLGSGHEGHPGWRIDDLSRHVEHWLERSRPHLILLQIGINDIINGASQASLLERMAELVDKITTRAPWAQLCVASLGAVLEPNLYEVKLASVLRFNRALPELVAVRQAQSANISFLDVKALTAFTPDDFAPDGLHPNDNGYRKMGEVWFQEVGRFLASRA